MTHHTREIIADCFAGAGGASIGIFLALGRHPDVAINHDPDAIRMHGVNHPDTYHFNSNIWNVDPDDVVRRFGPVGLLWASPDCKHFSKAKGGRPVKRNIRDLAWTVVLWARRARPRVIILENVEEFRHWGPVSADGKPCPERSGQTFDQWAGQLRRLGYKLEHRELRACDYGAPTIRKRLFVIARRDGEPIVWPEPTHGAPDDPDVIAGRKQPWRTAASIIDWSLPLPSIFLTKEQAQDYYKRTGVRLVRPLAEKTEARIARGVKRYVIDAAEPFIVTLNHGGDHQRGWALGEPFRTVTAARDAHALITPYVSYAQQGGGNRSATDPLHTICASTKDQNVIIAPTVMKFRADSLGCKIDAPLPTVTANSHIKRPGGAAPLGVAAAYLIPHPAGKPNRYGCGECGAVFHDKHASEAGGLAPAECPACGEEDNVTFLYKHPAEPDAVQVAYAAPHIMTMRNAGKPYTAANEPTHTVTAGGAGLSVVAAFMAQHNGGANMDSHAGRAVTLPLSTLTTTASQQAIVGTFMLTMKGSDRRMRAITDPASTLTAQGGNLSMVAALMGKYYGTGDGQALTEPCHTVTTRDRFGLITCTIHGQPMAIHDIGMRMLTPRELYRAQGFPDSYQIDHDAEGVRFTKSVQVRSAGNSVCPPLAEALVRANVELRDLTPSTPELEGPLFAVAAE